MEKEREREGKVEGGGWKREREREKVGTLSLSCRVHCCHKKSLGFIMTVVTYVITDTFGCTSNVV